MSTFAKSFGRQTKKMNKEKMSARGGSASGGKTKKKILSKFGLTILVFCAVFAATTAIKAAAGDVTGWILAGGTEADGVAPWDGTNTNFGWISMNSTNCNTDNTDGLNLNDSCDMNNDGVVNAVDKTYTIANYAVNVPNANGPVTGKGWSENIGWISFDVADLALCPDGACTARRVGNNIEGWARITSIAGVPGNAGGWTGWIKLNGTTTGPPASSYGIKIDPPTGNLSGYALSGNGLGGFELGWIDFTGAKIAPALPPTVTFQIDGAGSKTINVDISPLPQTVKLTWSSADATSCEGSSSTSLWLGATPHAETLQEVAGESITVDAANRTTTFTLKCTGPGGVTTRAVDVTTGCAVKSCGNSSCSPTFSTNGAATSATCVAASTCSTDTQCEARKPDGWIEVMP